MGAKIKTVIENRFVSFNWKLEMELLKKWSRGFPPLIPGFDHFNEKDDRENGPESYMLED